MTVHRTPGDDPRLVWRWTSCTPDAPAQARTALRCALIELGFSGEVINDAVLAVSELVTNATMHAAGPYEMRLRCSATEVICEVEDRDPRVPDVPAFPTEAPYVPAEENRGGGLDALCAVLSVRGRGLHIVNELTGGAWGFCGQAETKTAWFALQAKLQPMQHGVDSAPCDDLGVVDSTE